MVKRSDRIQPIRGFGIDRVAAVVGSLSEEHRMIGWRVGWVCGPATAVEDVGWVHVYNTTMPTAIARAAATAVVRGDQGHVQECVDELQRRRDCIVDGLPGWPFIRPAGGWSLLLDVGALGSTPEEASRLLLEEAGIAATGMTGWGDAVAARHVDEHVDRRVDPHAHSEPVAGLRPPPLPGALMRRRRGHKRRLGRGQIQHQPVELCQRLRVVGERYPLGQLLVREPSGAEVVVQDADGSLTIRV
jgi:Aminotransferase class I and II